MARSFMTTIGIQRVIVIVLVAVGSITAAPNATEANVTEADTTPLPTQSPNLTAPSAIPTVVPTPPPSFTPTLVPTSETSPTPSPLSVPTPETSYIPSSPLTPTPAPTPTPTPNPTVDSNAVPTPSGVFGSPESAEIPNVDCSKVVSNATFVISSRNRALVDKCVESAPNATQSNTTSMSTLTTPIPTTMLTPVPNLTTPTTPPVAPTVTSTPTPLPSHSPTPVPTPTSSSTPSATPAMTPASTPTSAPIPIPTPKSTPTPKPTVDTYAVPPPTAVPGSSEFAKAPNVACSEAVTNETHAIYSHNRALFDKCVADSQYQIFPYSGTLPNQAQIDAMARAPSCIAMYTACVLANLPQCDIAGMGLKSATETLLKISVDVAAGKTPPDPKQLYELLVWRRDVNLAQAEGIPYDQHSQLFSEYRHNLWKALTKTPVKVAPNLTISFEGSNAVATPHPRDFSTNAPMGLEINDVVGTVRPPDVSNVGNFSNSATTSATTTKSASPPRARTTNFVGFALAVTMVMTAQW